MDEIGIRNLRTVERFYESERQRDIDSWAAFWHPEGRHTYWLSSPVEPIVGRAQLVAVSQEKFDTRPPYEIHLQAQVLADPGTVFARLRLVGDTAPHPVHIWCLFHFDPDGLLREIEEVVDTAAAPTDPAPKKGASQIPND